METQSNPKPDSPASGSGAEPSQLQTDGLVLVPLAAAAALDPSVFSKINASEAIPASWEDRARKAFIDDDLDSTQHALFLTLGEHDA